MRRFVTRNATFAALGCADHTRNTPAFQMHEVAGPKNARRAPFRHDVNFAFAKDGVPFGHFFFAAFFASNSMTSPQVMSRAPPLVYGCISSIA